MDIPRQGICFAEIAQRGWGPRLLCIIHVCSLESVIIGECTPGGHVLSYLEFKVRNSVCAVCM